MRVESAVEIDIHAAIDDGHRARASRLPAVALRIGAVTLRQSDAGAERREQRGSEQPPHALSAW